MQNYTVNHKSARYFVNNVVKCCTNFYNIWPICVAQEYCNIFVPCCSPHLLGVVTIPQKVPCNYTQYTCESVPLTAAITLIIKMCKLHEQNHSNLQCLYVSVITVFTHVRNFGMFGYSERPQWLRPIPALTVLGAKGITKYLQVSYHSQTVVRIRCLVRVCISAGQGTNQRLSPTRFT